jgi:transglutaminase-like putative cysteine protease
VAFAVDIPPAVYDQPRFYWRGRVYDHFENGVWQTSAYERDNIAPIEDDLRVPASNIGTRALFNITTYLPNQHLLYAPAQPIWVNRAVEAGFFPTSAGELDVIALRARRALDPGDNYQARALVLNPPISALRSAGTDYPEWVTKRYLQLPENFSEKILSLSLSLTASLDTPYDKAVAITQYLRDHITFVERIDNPPPASADVMEWFLFESRQGYCNYYATAEVLMLRSLGIPARLAVGYAQGEANGDRTRYFIRQLDAHAWPEVYFPGIGWVEFEPTANQTPIIRPASPPEITTEQEPSPGEQVLPTPTTEISAGEESTEPDQAATAPRSINVTGLIILAVVALVVGALFVFRNSKPAVALRQQTPAAVRALMERYKFPVPRWIETWAAWNNLSPVEQAFDAINQALRHLAEKPLAASATPSERCEALKKLLPATAPEIDALLHEHQLNLYSPHRADVSRARRASRQIKWLVLRIRIAKYFS